MSETLKHSDQLPPQEIVAIFSYLLTILDQPILLLEAENELLFKQKLTFFQNQQESLNPSGLPQTTDTFYLREKQSVDSFSPHIARVLNIGSGGEDSRKLPAINIDLSPTGQPDVIADAQHLPFRDGVFSVVRASHILEHIPQSQLTQTLKEWRRVLNNAGELQIAVPDAAVTFQELVSGITPKGQPAFSLTESTAPLVQVYGLGYENPQTEPRWLHTIIFSKALIEYYLRLSDFSEVWRRAQQDDLSYLSQVDDDAQNHYSLLISARNELQPQVASTALTEKIFIEKCDHFNQSHSQISPASFVIPVCNEVKNLPHFLASLEHCTNLIKVEREFIFVINGCTDNSEEVLRRYLDGSFLNAQIIPSEKSIMTAFFAGTAARTLDGFVGKIDADILLHPHSLDLMQMFLVEQPEVQATYAEPTPIDSQFPFNEVEHNPLLRSQRRYIHGRTSLYRTSPFMDLEKKVDFAKIKVEDMFFSFYYVYFFGLESIAQTPHALIYSKTVKNLEDLALQIHRSRSEMMRIFEAFPPFKILEKILERTVFPSQYQEILKQINQATKHDEDPEEWTRLESSK